MNMLNYLDFETSDDREGVTTFDAMAYANAERWPALQAEVEQVLAWCTQAFGAPGPLDNGKAWDVDLQLQSDAGHALAVRWDARAGKLEAPDAAHCNARVVDVGLAQGVVAALDGALHQAVLDLADGVQQADVRGDMDHP